MDPVLVAIEIKEIGVEGKNNRKWKKTVRLVDLLKFWTMCVWNKRKKNDLCYGCYWIHIFLRIFFLFYVTNLIHWFCFKYSSKIFWVSINSLLYYWTFWRIINLVNIINIFIIKILRSFPLKTSVKFVADGFDVIKLKHFE